MDLVEDIHRAFKKYKTNPEDYIKKKDFNKDGMLSEADLKNIINDFCRLGFSQKEVDVLMKRYEHPKKRNFIEISPLLEDLRVFSKKEVKEEEKVSRPYKPTVNEKTPILGVEYLNFSTRYPMNVPGSKGYSMKNTVCGRSGYGK